MSPDTRGPAPLAGSADVDSVDSLLREAVDISEPSSAALISLGLMPGDLLLDRFVVGQRAHSGGMGAIYRGTDLRTEEAVAIKVMTSTGSGDANRFAKEAIVLADLSHPAIVRYIAHGTTPHATLFLIMEWLEGEDLSERLVRVPLTVEESLSLVTRACEGIAVAHARGVVHRDIKPSNLFLLKGDPVAIKVLDFGIARRKESTHTLTQSGTFLGTVGYMSPEQAMGPRDVGAAADVFALGCVLFECLTGRPAFVGPNAVAVLAKVLREDPPRVSELRPGLGEALDVLVARMVAKTPDERPKDASTLLRALGELGRTASGTSSLPSPSVGLTAAEQKIVTVILGRPRRGLPQPAEPVDIDMGRVQEVTRRFGVEPVAMRGGGLLVVFSGRGAATDQASQAARCALLLEQVRSELCLAIATGRAETSERIPVGIAIDRAARLLHRIVGAEIAGGPETDPLAQSNDSRMGVTIDELTAGLLEPLFEVHRDGGQLVLVEERADLEAIRLLMGKPTPFVGRDKELGLLDLTLRECIDESVARAVLVTGPPGQGKSRLRHEFVSRARMHGGIRILVARADSIGAGSAFLLARQIVRHAVGLRDSAQPTDQQDSLRSYVTSVCRQADAARIADFLGELIGAPGTDRPSPELRAARDDPQLMSAWLRRSFGEWLASECAQKPLLLVLEDLHWGDLPSVTYLGEGLRALSAQPLMVLALARPEIHQEFPNLWNGAESQEIALDRLTPRAAARLVREALGQQLAPTAVSRIIERADGNAFYLEELIRGVAEGDSHGLPETVLALVQSRLDRLEPEARRVVRAASIFGEMFHRDGVAALLGAATSPSDVEAWLRTLAQKEVVALVPESGLQGDTGYRFRHSLLREAAYAMLSEPDRATGHGLAGDWLEHAGEKDALALADHFERSVDRSRAVPWLLRAASPALYAGSVEAAIQIAGRGLDSNPDGSQCGHLYLVQVAALQLRGDYRECVAAGHKAMGLLKSGSTSWFNCVALMFNAATFLGARDVATPLLQTIRTVPVTPKSSVAYLAATHATCMGLAAMGAIDTAREFCERIESLSNTTSNSDPVFVSRLQIMRAAFDLCCGEVGGPVITLPRARILAEDAGDVWGISASASFLIAAFREAGSYDRAAAAARDISARPEMSHWSGWSVLSLASSMVLAHRLRDARELLQPLFDQTDRYLALSARAWLAQGLVDALELDAAVHQASIALAEGALFSVVRTLALTVLGQVELCRECPAAALGFAADGFRAALSGTRFASVDSSLGLLKAEALHALGDHAAAREAIRAARERILRIAATLDDTKLRECYTTNIAANARTLKLAGEWLGEDSSPPV